MDPSKFPPPGDFSWSVDKDFLQDAYQAITAAGAWDFFRQESPPEGKGYMFWDSPALKGVQAKMKMLDAHSGASFGYTMRVMEAIAKNGWVSWVANHLDPRSYSSG